MPGSHICREIAASDGFLHGLINRFVAQPGRRDELAALIIGEEAAMGGCRSFIVACDDKEPDVMWITEAWESEAHWAASMEVPSVKASIEKATPLISSFGETVVSVPVGGMGL